MDYTEFCLQFLDELSIRRNIAVLDGKLKDSQIQQADYNAFKTISKITNAARRLH